MSSHSNGMVFCFHRPHYIFRDKREFPVRPDILVVRELAKKYFLLHDEHYSRRLKVEFSFNFCSCVFERGGGVGGANLSMTYIDRGGRGIFRNHVLTSAIATPPRWRDNTCMGLSFKKICYQGREIRVTKKGKK